MYYFPKFYGYQVSVEDTTKINTNQVVGNRRARDSSPRKRNLQTNSLQTVNAACIKIIVVIRKLIIFTSMVNRLINTSTREIQ